MNGGCGVGVMGVWKWLGCLWDDWVKRWLVGEKEMK